MKPSRLVLASTSRYRKELLSRLTILFECANPDVDEAPLPAETPIATALRLAEAKARSIAPRFPDALIIGSDQVAVCEGQRLDKPMRHSAAVAQLRFASGKAVTFHSAVALLNSATESLQCALTPTQVRFRTLSARQIESYLRKEAAYDCAGSARAEGLGIALMEEIRSTDPTALIGLPLIVLSAMLRAEGVDPLTVDCEN